MDNISKENNNLRKSFIWNTIGILTTSITSIIYMMILTRYSNLEEVGIFAFCFSFACTMVTLASFGGRTYQVTDLNSKFKTSTYINTRYITVIFSYVLIVIFLFFKDYNIEKNIILLLLCLFKFFEEISDVYYGILQKNNKLYKVGIYQFFKSIINIILFFIGIRFLNNLFLSILFITINNLFFILLIERFNAKKIENWEFLFDKKEIKKLLNINVYICLFTFLSMYLVNSPKYAIDNYLTSEIQAIFNILMMPSTFMVLIGGFILNPLLVNISKLYLNNKEKELKIIIKYITLIILIIGISSLIFVYFFGTNILEFIYDLDFSNYKYELLIVIFGSILYTFSSIISTLLISLRKIKVQFVISIICSILAYFTSYYFVKEYSLIGGVYSYLIIMFFRFLFYVILLYKFLFCKKRKYDNDIIYIRSTSIINDSRASKEISSLLNNNYNVYVLGLDRDKKIKDYDNISLNNKNINGSFFKFNCRYGIGVKTIIGLFFFQIWLLYKLIINNKKYKYVHACDFDCGFVSMIICKIFNKKMVYDIYDYYSDSRNMPNKIEKIINKLENKVINYSVVTIICGEWRKKQIEGSSPKKIVVIHNTPDINLVDRKVIVKSSNKKIKIAYVGILQEHRLLMEILEEVKTKEKYELHIGGFGLYEDYLIKMSEKYNNIYFYGSLVYADVLNLEKDCDLLFATYDPKIRNHKYSAPNKIYEAMALGKPIIVCKNTGIDKFVTKYKLGQVINYDAKDFFDKINNIFSENKKLKEFSFNSKKLYNEKFSWSIMEKKLINIYKGLGSEDK